MAFPLAIYKPLSGKDVEALVRFKPVAATVDRAGGIAVRLTTYDDDYAGRRQRARKGIRAASPSDGHQPSKADHFLQGAIHG